MVDSLQRKPQKCSPSLYAHYPFAMWLCCFFHQEVENISPHFKSELSLSLARMKRMWWKWWLWLPSLGLKKTFRTCARSVGVLHWNCHEKKTRLQGHKILFDQVVLAEAPSDQSVNNQSTTPTNVSEAISDYPTPINLPVNQSHVTDSRWDKKKSHSVVPSPNCLPTES